MTLYEFVNGTERDYDAYDDASEYCVTVCYISPTMKHDDYNHFCYNHFCMELMKKVKFVKQTSDCIVVCKWYDFINWNFDKFKAFSREHWEDTYDDEDDEFIYQWIQELHGYIAGDVPDDFYSTLLDFVNTLEGCVS